MKEMERNRNREKINHIEKIANETKGKENRQSEE